MADAFPFSVDDTSPLVSYSPFSDTFSTPDLLGGWNPYFNESGFASSQGVTGRGTSLHVTSRDGASLSLQWNGTGIELYGTAINASYNITLDGDNFDFIQPDNPLPGSTLATLHGLKYGLHTIQLTAHITTGPSTGPSTGPRISFDEALIFLPSLRTNSSLTTRPLNDLDISFMGMWSYQNGSSSPDQPWQRQPYHVSSKLGDRAQSQFQGIGLTITGGISPSAGQYSVTLDNHTTIFSARSSFNQPDALLFYATGLDGNQTHDVMIRNEEDRTLSVQAAGFVVLTAQNGTDSSVPVPASSLNSDLSRGTIAALILGGVLGFLAISFALYYCLAYRPRAIRRNQEQSDTPVFEIMTIPKSDNDKGKHPAVHRFTSDDDTPVIQSYKHQSPSAKANLSPIIIPDTRRTSTKSNSSGKQSKGKKKVQHSSPNFTLDLASVSHGSDLAGGRRSSGSSSGQSSDADHNVSPQKSTHVGAVASSSGPRHVRHGSQRMLLERYALGNESEDYSDEEVSALPTGTTAGHGYSSRTSEVGRPRRVTNLRSSLPATFGVGRDNDDEQRRRTPVLEVRETSPFRIDFFGLPWRGVSREPSGSNGSAIRSKISKSSQLSLRSHPSGTSRMSRARHQRSGREPLESRQDKGDEVDLEQNDQGRNQGTPRDTVVSPDQSFLNLSLSSRECSGDSGRSISKQNSRTSAHNQPRSHWSVSSGCSIPVPDPATMPPLPTESSHEAHDVPQPTVSDQMPHHQPSGGSGSSSWSFFPYPISIPSSPFTPDSRPIVESPQDHPSMQQSIQQSIQSPAIHFPAPPYRIAISSERSGSSADSLPATVSDIHFRHPPTEAESAESTYSRRISTGPRPLPHPPLPTVLSGLHNVYSRSPTPPQVTPANLESEPYIVQRVLGLPTTPSNLALSTPNTIGRSASAALSSGTIPGASSPPAPEISNSPDSPQILAPSLRMRSRVGQVGKNLIDLAFDSKPKPPGSSN